MKDVILRGFKEYADVDSVLATILGAVEQCSLEAEEAPVSEACGRVLAEDVKAELDIPYFNRSAVDGFAVRAKDTFGSSITNPLILKVVGEVEIGTAPSVKLGEGEATKIATGAPLPEGSDAVLMLEYVNKLSEQEIEVYRPVAPGENVSKVGEDIKRGDVILRKGSVLRPQDIGVLISTGLSKVRVVRRARVGVLSTGEELVEPGEKLEMGKIYDVNRTILAAMVKEVGGEFVDLGIAKDELPDLKSKLKSGLRKSDLVLVSGGTSVGRGDLVPMAINSLGGPGVLIHGVSMRPGKPTALAVVNGKPIISLPGNPVAAMIAFDTFVVPILERMSGAQKLKPKVVVRAKVLRRIASRPGMRDHVRVIVKKSRGEYVAEPVMLRGASVLSSMVRANGIIVIPEAKEGVEAGEGVDVILFKPVE